MPSFRVLRRSPPPRLRAYQLEPARAIFESIRHRLGLTFVVEISRQGGKNELSSRIEATVLVANSQRGGGIVKGAPTLEPQLRISHRRLADYLERDNVRHRSAWPDLFVGNAALYCRSAESSANAAGATADLLLEIDEAQDVDPEVYQRRFRPMAATTNATTVMYGTAWSEVDLLQTTIDDNAELERRDGIRRNFIINADVVGAELPPYKKFVDAERARLGANHPLLQTEYDLIPLAGEGRFLSPAQLRIAQGTHPALPGPILADHYVAALDVGGEDTGSGAQHDRTVLTIGRVLPADVAGVTPVEVVAFFASQGRKHSEVIPSVVAEVRRWGVYAVVVDATGIGEPTAGIIRAQLPRVHVESFKFSQVSKSELGFQFLTAVNTGAYRIHAPDGSDHHALLSRELAAARREIRSNKTMNFFVPADQGNDDYLLSSTLLVRAAQAHSPRVARGR